MKRSEMVEILEKAINSGLYQDYQFSAEYISEILKTLEDHGMQPPNVTLGKLFPNSGLQEDEKHYFGCWEPENE